MQKSKRKNKNDFEFKKGFTLLEMVISIGIFSVLVVTTIAITLSMATSQAKTANIQATQDNIRFSLELITKEMRTGTGYELKNLCTVIPGAEIHFLSTDPVTPSRVYYLDNATGIIMRSKESIGSSGECGRALPFTANEVVVERLSFILRGQAAGGNDGQPMATIALKVTARDPRMGTATSMNLQTTVVSRLRDL